MYAFFPGCVSRGGCPELYPATISVCERLGIRLNELKGASCTGAGVLQEKNQLLGDIMNARTFAMAEDLDLPIMTICSTCQGVMSQANKRLTSDPEYLKKVNNYLIFDNLKYGGTTVIKHLLWVIIEDIGIDKLQSFITRPLNGFKIAPFYGCYILRPSDALGFNENPERQNSLEIIIAALGAEVVDFAGKSRCCGFPLLTINEKNSNKMVAKHTTEVKELGADAMVTPCPLCHLNLDGYQPVAAAQEDKGDINMPIIHLPQLLGLALGEDPINLGFQRHIVSANAVLEKMTLVS